MQTSLPGSFWDRLNAQCRLDLQKMARQGTFAKDQMIFRAGETLDAFFIIHKGLCKVFRVQPNGSESILSFFGPGSVVALQPLLQTPPTDWTRLVYPANCMALTNTELSQCGLQQLPALLDQNPDIGSCLQAEFVNRTAMFRDKAALLMLPSASDRIIGFLEQMGARGNEVYLPIPKNQLANYLGLSAEALSRNLGKLKRAGLLKESDGYYELTDQLD
ncbi:MAG: Crp/Fnr family transcriptional regulator [Leptospiraceae bacterium]|nr:Crp/Fnr family transcriptional regulator [Leptospiraceae bacterium]